MPVGCQCVSETMARRGYPSSNKGHIRNLSWAVELLPICIFSICAQFAYGKRGERKTPPISPWYFRASWGGGEMSFFWLKFVQEQGILYIFDTKWNWNIEQAYRFLSFYIPGSRTSSILWLTSHPALQPWLNLKIFASVKGDWWIFFKGGIKMAWVDDRSFDWEDA